MNYSRKKKIVCWLLVVAAFFLCLNLPVRTEAAGSETAFLRIYSTTDLHGKSTRYNYDTGSYSQGSLAQISNVINESKKSLTDRTATLLVDVGDTIFGFGTNGIVHGSISGEEYMYSIMKKMGYDAMTLGNHDFDYGSSYIMSALKKAGVNKKVLAANLKNAKTGKYPWTRAKIIKKKVVTSAGKERTVRIGVIGVVTPTGATVKEPEKLTATDIVNAVKNRVTYLKNKKKADVIVVLSHSGIGSKETWVTRGESVSYKLCFIDGVDVVCAGHSHVNYPSTDANVASVYSYKGVDQKTGFINGTLLIQSADHGKAFGISDLKLTFKKNGKVKVTPKKATVRKITKSDAEDPKVLSWNSAFDTQFKELYEQCLAKAETSTNNYFGMIEDNAMMQIANEAKIAYGNKIVAQYAPDLKDCPVISDSSYRLTGAINASSYMVTGESLTMTDILNEQPWSRESAGVYYVTGAQLRENLEWKASMYGSDSIGNYGDSLLNSFAEEGYVPVINSTWKQWTNFPVFDGIEYEIDATVAPRYNLAGTAVINDTNRIRNLTYNGEPVTEDQVFVWVTFMGTGRWTPNKTALLKQKIVSGKAHITDLIRDYLTEQGKLSAVSVETDENWRVHFDENRKYVIKSSADAEDIALTKPWYGGVLAENNGYAYYAANFVKETEDTAAPMLVLSNLGPELSGDPIDIRVNSNDRSGLEGVWYLKGNFDKDAREWTSAEAVTDGTFAVLENGIYSVLAIDTLGNAVVKQIDVQNIDPTVATAPIVNKCTNKQCVVTGTAYADATIEVLLGDETYQTSAGSEGTYQCEVPYLKAGEIVKVRQLDNRGRISAYTAVRVTRKAANYPEVLRVTNKQTGVSGTLDDLVYCKAAVKRGSVFYLRSPPLGVIGTL